MGIRRGLFALAAAWGALGAVAADIVLTPTAGNGVSLTASGGSTVFRVDDQGMVLLSGHLHLVETSSNLSGAILKGGWPFIHNFGIGNLFMGVGAGNFSMTGTHNTGIGRDVIFGITSGNDNSAFGSRALSFNTTGSSNTAFGREALYTNSSGSSNTAIGWGALYSNTTATGNTATGARALYSNTAVDNTAHGYLALRDNTTGHSNTATGRGALLANSIGDENSAYGTNALHDNTEGSRNTASGNDALFNNTVGFSNTASGGIALYSNTSGYENTAFGYGSLNSNVVGINNVAVGAYALANLTGNNNIALGAYAGVNLHVSNSSIMIGANGSLDDDQTIRIGTSSQLRTFIGGIRGKTTGNANAIPVMIDSLGQLGTVSSSGRFKDDIADMDSATDGLMQLRPVTFHYKSDQDPAGRTLQYGLVAEEVAEVYPGLVARSSDGEVETVMYQFLPSMLLNEVQKLHREVAALRAELASTRRQR